METVVSVSNLVKRYGSFTAVNGLSFDVKRGEIFGLLGPNGAGKTTTLECLEGIRTANAGTMSVAGCDPNKQSQMLRKKLGVQLQSSSLPDSIKPMEAMELICSWHGLDGRPDLLERFDLGKISAKQYRELSTGQKRRLHLALAMASKPEVIILDEPTAGLDVQGRAQLHDAIRQLKNESITLLLATHDMAEAESLCDRIAIIIRGQIAIVGTPEQVTAAGNSETKITLRTKKQSLSPGHDIGQARFYKESEGFGIWLCRDAAAAVTDLLKAVKDNGDMVDDLRVERPSLEERFLEIVEGGKQS